MSLQGEREALVRIQGLSTVSWTVSVCCEEGEHVGYPVAQTTEHLPGRYRVR
jgi:hypothetical protein